MRLCPFRRLFPPASSRRRQPKSVRVPTISFGTVVLQGSFPQPKPVRRSLRDHPSWFRNCKDDFTRKGQGQSLRRIESHPRPLGGDDRLLLFCFGTGRYEKRHGLLAKCFCVRWFGLRDTPQFWVSFRRSVSGEPRGYNLLELRRLSKLSCRFSYLCWNLTFPRLHPGQPGCPSVLGRYAKRFYGLSLGTAHLLVRPTSTRTRLRSADRPGTARRRWLVHP
jgi:hypothetical protein